LDEYPSPTRTSPFTPITNVPPTGSCEPSQPPPVSAPNCTGVPETTMGEEFPLAIAGFAPRQRASSANRATHVPAAKDRTGLVNLFKVVCISSSPICFHPRTRESVTVRFVPYRPLPISKLRQAPHSASTQALNPGVTSRVHRFNIDCLLN